FSSLSSCFCFCASSVHLRLPSFPTRRSSDLALGADHLADLVDRDLDRGDARGVGAHLVRGGDGLGHHVQDGGAGVVRLAQRACQDRKSTRLNSSHVKISYAVFCLKKKKRKR